MSSAYKSTLQMSDEEVVERVKADLKKSQAWKDDNNTRCRAYAHIYQTLDPPDQEIEGMEKDADERLRKNYSNTYMGIGAALVDTVVTQLYNYIFGTDEYFAMASDEFEDDLYTARLTAHMKKRHREMRYRQKVYRCLLQMACFDFSASFMRWKVQPGYEYRRVTKREMTKIGGLTLPYQRTTVEPVMTPTAIDRPDMVILDYFNCYPDRDAVDIEDSEFFIDLRKDPIEHLRAMQKSDAQPFGKYKNIDKVIKKLEEAGDNQPSLPSEEDRDTLDHSRRIKITRYWTPNEVIEVAEDLVISRTKICGIPIHLWKYWETPGRFEGMGILQRLERNQVDINACFNSLRDAQNFQSRPPAVMSGDVAESLGGQDPEVEPGRVYTTTGDADKGLAFPQLPVDPSQGALDTAALETEMARQVVGASENQGGSFTSGRRTASEAREVAAGAAGRTLVIADRIAESCIEPGLVDQFVLEQINMTKPDSFKYVGKWGTEFVTIRPEDYKHGATPKIYALGPSHARFTAERIQQFMTGLNMAMMVPQAHNMELLLAKMWQLLDPRDGHRFVRDPRMKTHNVPPNIENELMAAEHEPEISPENDHGVHIRVHSTLKSTPDYQLWPERSQMILERHLAEHQNAQVATANQNFRPPVERGMQDGSDVLRGLS